MRPIGGPATPCLVIGVGALRKGRGENARFELALKRGAGVETETTDPKEAYARFAEDKPVVCPPEFPEAPLLHAASTPVWTVRTRAWPRGHSRTLAQTSDDDSHRSGSRGAPPFE
jgi:hypothetical protein